MSSTNRDVTINVTVNPQMDKASDGLQQIGIRASEAEKQVAKLLERLEAVSRGHNGGATVIDIQDPNLAAGVSNTQRQQTVNRGNGGTTVVDDPNQLSDAERAMAHSAGKIQRQRQKVQENHQAGHQKISDNDVANAVKATNKAKQEAKESAEEEARAVKAGAAAQEAYVGASRAAAMSAMEFAKGLALVAASGDDNNDSLIRGIAQIQGYFNLIRGGMSTMQAFNNALKLKAAAETASNAAAMAGKGSTTATGGATASGTGGGIGGASATLNPYALLAAAAIGTAIAIRELGVWARELKKQQKADDTSYRGFQSEAANSTVGRHVQQSMRMIDRMPDLRAMNQEGINHQRRTQIESQIVAEQGASNRDFGPRQEIRARREREGAIQERKAAAANAMFHSANQGGELAVAKSRFQEDKSASLKAHEAKVESIKKQFLEKPDAGSQASPQSVFGGKRSWLEYGLMNSTPLGVAATLTGGTGKGSIARHIVTGEDTNAQIEAHNEGKKKELREAAVSRAGQVNAEADRGVDLAQKEVELGKRKVESAGEYLNALREQAAAARQNYEADKQTVDNAHQQLGGMTPGQLIRHQQIEAKMKAGKELTHYELRVASSLAGSDQANYARKQMDKKGAKSGIGFTDIDLKGQKDKADATKKELDNKEPLVVGAIKEQGRKNDAAGRELIAAIKESDRTEDLFNALEAIFKEQALVIDRKIADFKSSWRG